MVRPDVVCGRTDQEEQKCDELALHNPWVVSLDAYPFIIYSDDRSDFNCQ